MLRVIYDGPAIPFKILCTNSNWLLICLKLLLLITLVNLWPKLKGISIEKGESMHAANDYFTVPVAQGS